MCFLNNAGLHGTWLRFFSFMDMVPTWLRYMLVHIRQVLFKYRCVIHVQYGC